MPDADVELGSVIVLAIVIACIAGMVMARRMFPPTRVRIDRIIIALFLIPVFIAAVVGLLTMLGELIRENP